MPSNALNSQTLDVIDKTLKELYNPREKPPVDGLYSVRNYPGFYTTSYWLAYYLEKELTDVGME